MLKAGQLCQYWHIRWLAEMSVVTGEDLEISRASNLNREVSYSGPIEINANIVGVILGRINETQIRQGTASVMTIWATNWTRYSKLSLT